ncbi:MAG: hypothetical protein Q7S22_07120 [Candidatus Micrarchaeota archaeon]|nr:hypothetical protein [Candidatus Micrarchaeota archaeon]
MDFVTYHAAEDFVKGLKELDPIRYREISLKDVLPYFAELTRRIERIRS